MLCDGTARDGRSTTARRSPRRSSTRRGAAATRCCSSSSRSTRRRCFFCPCLRVRLLSLSLPLCLSLLLARGCARTVLGGSQCVFLFVLFFSPCSQRAGRSRRRPGARRGARAPPLDESTSRREREQRWRSHVGMCVTTIDVFSTVSKEDPTAAHQMVLRWSRVRAMAWSHEDVT